jgi:hypothetical protein
LYINFRAVYASINQHIINVNPSYTFDFFLHGWNVDLKEQLVSLYHPKLHCFEENNIYHDEFIAKTKNLSGIAGPSQCLSIKKSIELKEAHEVQHGRYDKVIIYRYDVLLWKDMLLSAYDDDSVYCNRLLFGPFSSLGGDYHFVMSSEKASQFKHLYDWITSDNPFQAHYSIKKYMDHLSIPFKEDDITIHINQEVLRFIHKSKLHRFHHLGISENDSIHAPTHIHFTVSAIPSLLVISLLWSIMFHKSSWYKWLIFYIILSFIIQWLLLYVLDIEYTIAVYILLLFIIELTLVH